MSFSSVIFFVFLFAVFFIYWKIPHKYRYLILICANIVFYASFGTRFLTLLVLIVFATYLIGNAMEDKPKKSGVFLCFAALVLPLLIFKYLEFFIYSAGKVLAKLSIPVSDSSLKLIAPLGISFFTFEAVAYVYDVYKGKIKAEKNLLKLFVFIAFFPTITSGPIKRAGDFIPQIDKVKTFDYDEVVYGFRLILLGLIKKVVMADYLALFVNNVFDNVYFYRGPVFIVATVLYTFEIYLDFSGYTDMARGAAAVFGFSVKENFKSPYLSKNINEFWNRWHISLSSWLRDYIYIPLGGNRKGKVRKLINLMITFFVSGLWHGANFTFIAWGLLHGIYQCFASIFTGRKSKNIVVFDEYNKKKKMSILTDVVGTLFTFALISFAWLFFRVNSLTEAVFILRNTLMFENFIGYMLAMGFLTAFPYIFVTVIILVTIIYDVVSEKKDVVMLFSKLPVVLRWIFYIALISLVILVKSHLGNSADFIYFKF